MFYTCMPPPLYTVASRACQPPVSPESIVAKIYDGISLQHWSEQHYKSVLVDYGIMIAVYFVLSTPVNTVFSLSVPSRAPPLGWTPQSKPTRAMRRPVYTIKKKKNPPLTPLRSLTPERETSILTYISFRIIWQLFLCCA